MTRQRRLSKLAAELARTRWRKIPKRERSELVPQGNGGAARKFPPCPRYPAHVFSPRTGRCPCGFARPKRELTTEEKQAPFADRNVAPRRQRDPRVVDRVANESTQKNGLEVNTALSRMFTIDSDELGRDRT